MRLERMAVTGALLVAIFSIVVPALPAGGMTPRAILKIRNTFLAVLALDPCLFVAAVASIGR